MSTTNTAAGVGGADRVSRRGFLGGTVGGLALAFILPEVGNRGVAEAAGGGGAGGSPGTAVNAWLRIGTDESITLTVGSSEMGQGSFSGLAQVLAEDLMVDYARVATAQGGPTVVAPAPLGTAINTVGSSVTRTNFWRLRDAAAAAREMLVQAAMNANGDQNRANYTVANGVIAHVPSGASVTYGQVAAAAALLPVPKSAALVPDAQFRLIGKTMPRFDIPAKVDGSATYGIDVRLPNMLYGIVKHSPALGGTLASAAITASVAGRFVFYNNSSFDGGNASANPADDAAVATDKSALLPGQTATFANYTSYARGINGVMVDVAGLPASTTAVTAAQFAFLAGTDADPANWTASPAPASVMLRRGAGRGGSDRITLLFADQAVMNQWLRVTVLAGPATGLAADDVFYFGNLVGETGNSATSANVTVGDINVTKSQVGSGLPITNVADFNRSGSVTVGDINIVKMNGGGTLPLITAPVTVAPPRATAVIPTKVFAGTDRGLEATNNVNAVVVVGTNTWDAWQAAKRLPVTWTAPASAAVLNSAQFQSDAAALAAYAPPYVAGGANPPGTLYTVEGDAGAASAAIDAGAPVVEATYTLPYVAHACMEVLNCTVDYVAGVKCDVYAPTQSSKAALTMVMALTGLSAGKVNIFTTYLGGGLGRKAEVDFISQAVQVGMALGRPVKVMWPREEDFTHDQYRPMALIRVKASLDAGGGVSGWSYRNVSPSILAQRGSVLGAKGDSQAYEASQGLPYRFGARVTEYVTHPSGIPVGFWRSVGASLNTFGVESMVDELASAAGADAYLFRRNLLTDPRWIAVLDAAAALGNWNSPVPVGRARGIAIGTAFNSIVAEVVEVSALTATGVTVHRVSVAIDCYLVVNPGQVETQLIGGVVHGLNAALYGKQTFAGGVAQSRNFNKSRMIRMNEMPQVDVTIIPSPAAADRARVIGGVGELGVPTLAPALANACFKLNGTRIRSLPLFPSATMGGL